MVLTEGGLVRLLIAYDAALPGEQPRLPLLCAPLRRPQFSFDQVYSRELMRDAVPIMVAGLVINAYGRVDVLMLKAVHRQPVGRILRLRLPAYRSGRAAQLHLCQLGLPAALGVSRQGRDGRVQDGCISVRTTSFRSPGMTISTGVILFAPHIVTIIGGDDYAAAVTSLRVLALAFALIWLSNLVNYSLIAVGKQHVLLWAACLAWS